MKGRGLIVGLVCLILGSLLINSVPLVGGAEGVPNSTQTITQDTVPAKNTAGRQSPFLLNLNSAWIKANGRVEGTFSGSAKDGRDASATIGVEWTETTLGSLMIVADDEVRFSRKLEKSDGVHLWLAGKEFFFNDRAYVLSGKKWKVCKGIKTKVEIIKKPVLIFPRGYSIMIKEIPAAVLGWKTLTWKKEMEFNVMLQDIDKKNKGKILWAKEGGWLTPGKQAIFHIKK